jgi:hypothetical protein
MKGKRHPPGIPFASGKTGGGIVMAARKKARSSGKRDTVRSKSTTRYAKRGPRGRFKEMDDKGRSLTADRRTRAKRRVRSGYGDRGDRAA